MEIMITKEILDIINAVLDYKKFITSHNYVVPKEDFDWFSDTEKYYHSLPLPEGMEKNRYDFERILDYGRGFAEKLEMLNRTNYSDLHYHKWK